MREQHDHDDGNAVADAKRRLTVFTGASGSGKSSLVFGTITAESRVILSGRFGVPTASDCAAVAIGPRRLTHGCRVRPVGDFAPA
jgi:hypothetical protein